MNRFVLILAVLTAGFWAGAGCEGDHSGHEHGDGHDHSTHEHQDSTDDKHDQSTPSAPDPEQKEQR